MEDRIGQYAGLAELADARDLKSREINISYRFDPGFRHHYIAGWSSPVARRAHNPKVVRFKSHSRNQKNSNHLFGGLSSFLLVAGAALCFTTFGPLNRVCGGKAHFSSLSLIFKIVAIVQYKTQAPQTSGSNIASFVVSDRRIANNPK